MKGMGRFNLYHYNYLYTSLYFKRNFYNPWWILNEHYPNLMMKLVNVSEYLEIIPDRPNVASILCFTYLTLDWILVFFLMFPTKSWVHGWFLMMIPLVTVFSLIKQLLLNIEILIIGGDDHVLWPNTKRLHYTFFNRM